MFPRYNASHGRAAHGASLFHRETPAQPFGGPAHVREAVAAIRVIIGKPDPVVCYRESTMIFSKLQVDGHPVRFRMAVCVGERVVRYREEQAPGLCRQRRLHPRVSHLDGHRGDVRKAGGESDGKNAIRRIFRTDYLTYKIEVSSGNNGTGTYQLKVRVNNICRINDDGDAQYQWAGGPEGYPAHSDLPAGTGGRQVLLAGTEYSNYVSRPELHHVLGDNWDSNPDEDWIGVDLQQGEEYTVRLRTKTSLPERLQATQLKILGIKDADGNAISGTASAGAAGKKVFVTNWEAPSTGRHYIAVGTEGTDLTGTYWISITRKFQD